MPIRSSNPVRQLVIVAVNVENALLSRYFANRCDNRAGAANKAFQRIVAIIRRWADCVPQPACPSALCQPDNRFGRVMPSKMEPSFDLPEHCHQPRKVGNAAFTSLVVPGVQKQHAVKTLRNSRVGRMLPACCKRWFWHIQVTWALRDVPVNGKSITPNTFVIWAQPGLRKCRINIPLRLLPSCGSIPMHTDAKYKPGCRLWFPAQIRHWRRRYLSLPAEFFGNARPRLAAIGENVGVLLREDHHDCIICGAIGFHPFKIPTVIENVAAGAS